MIQLSPEALRSYAGSLSGLLNFDEKTDITKMAPPSQPSCGRFMAFFMGEPSKINENTFKTTVEDWNSVLYHAWEKISNASQLDPIELQKIQVVARYILSEDKIEKIRASLKRHDIHHTGIIRALDGLETNLKTIKGPDAPAPKSPPPKLNLPKSIEAKQVESSPPATKNHQSLVKSHSSPNLDLAPIHFPEDRAAVGEINDRALSVMLEKQKRKAILQKLEQEVCLLTHMKEPEKGFKLLQLFIDLQDSKLQGAFAKTLNHELLLILLEKCLNAENLLEHLPCIAIHLPFNILTDLLMGADEVQINLLKNAFTSVKYTSEPWFQRELNERRKEIGKRLEQFKECADYWYHKFITNAETWITSLDIKKMDQEENEMRVCREGYLRLCELLQNIKMKEEFRRYFNGIPGTPSIYETAFETLFNRMSNEPERYEKVANAPYKIIHDKVFPPDCVLDPGDAGEIFGNWGLTLINHFFKTPSHLQKADPKHPAKIEEDVVPVELIVEPPESKIKEWQKFPGDGFKLTLHAAVPQLSAYAFEHWKKSCAASSTQPGRVPSPRLKIGDEEMKAHLKGIYLWRYLRIYNRWMLKDFLEREDIKKLMKYDVLIQKLKTKAHL